MFLQINFTYCFPFDINFISIGYTMEKCGIYAYVTHEFAVFPEAKPSEKTGKRVCYQDAYTTRFHGVTDL